jgi:hypothetical protein
MDVGCRLFRPLFDPFTQTCLISGAQPAARRPLAPPSLAGPAPHGYDPLSPLRRSAPGAAWSAGERTCLRAGHRPAAHAGRDATTRVTLRDARGAGGIPR